MAVNRRGKRGTRAGHMIPESRNKRVRRNAAIKRITGHDDDRATRNKTSREEWVVHFVMRELGGHASYVEADDVASDIIFDLLNCGGFAWEEEEIRIFCRKKVKGMLLSASGRKEVRECDINLGGDFDAGYSVLESLMGAVGANQENYVDAKIWLSRLQNIPGVQRKALEILCGGGNPIDVAKEMGIEPWAAIALIKEGRRYIHMVDGDDELGGSFWLDRAA